MGLCGRHGWLGTGKHTYGLGLCDMQIAVRKWLTGLHNHRSNTTMLHKQRLRTIRIPFQALVTLACVGIHSEITLAQPVLGFDVSEVQRLYGEDNLYNEAYGRRMAMHGGTIVLAGHSKAAIFHATQTGTNVCGSIDAGLPDIDDVAVGIGSVVFGDAASHYSISGPTGGTVTIWRRGFNCTFHHSATLTTPDASVTGYQIQNFGASVAASGNVVLVGAPNSRECCSGNVDGPGFVFVYHFDGDNWNLVSWFTSDDEEPWRYFGASISMSHEHAIIGAPRESSAPAGQYGAAYIFSRNANDQFSQLHKLDPIDTPTPTSDNNWATHVGGNGYDLWAIGADGAVGVVEKVHPSSPFVFTRVPLPGRVLSRAGDAVAASSQRVFYIDQLTRQIISVYDINNTWQEWRVYDNPYGSFPMGIVGADRFFAVGYPTESVAGPRTGRAMVYRELNDFFEHADLIYGDAEDGDLFGRSVATTDLANGRYGALIAAPQDDGNKGAIYRYVYDLDNDAWTKTERWQPDGIWENAHFGHELAYARPFCYAASAKSTGSVPYGAVYARNSTGITRIDGPELSCGFGDGLAYHGEILAVGATESAGASGYSGAVYIYGYSGNEWQLTQTLTGANNFGETPPSYDAEFGETVVMNDEWLIAGAPRDERDGPSSGAAFIYRRTPAGWQYFQRLETGDITAEDLFGHSLAIQDDWLFVGAPHVAPDSANGGEGAVYAFQFDGNRWNLNDKFLPFDGVTDGSFGGSLAVRSRDLVIGAPGVDHPNVRVGGTIYTYRYFGGSWLPANRRIDNQNPGDDDFAGRSVAIAGDMILVGADGGDGAANNAGEVVIQRYRPRVRVPSPLDGNNNQPPCLDDFASGFRQQMRSPISELEHDDFGRQVVLWGDVMAVSEPYADVDFVDDAGVTQVRRIGSVHIYRRTDVDKWTLEETITPPVEDLTPALRTTNFGQTLALDDELLVVGNHGGQLVYVYEYTTAGWNHRTTIENTDGARSFGSTALAVAGDTILISDAYETLAGITGVGALYFYQRIDRNAWELVDGPVICSEAYFGQHFGYRVALDDDGTRAVVTGDRLQAGLRTVYLYELINDSWQETTKLNVDGENASINFGSFGLDISGNHIAVGDADRYADNVQPGSVFMWQFDGKTWVGPHILIGSNPGFQDKFGSTLALDGNMLVVGAPSAYREGENNGHRTGAVYVFGHQNELWDERWRYATQESTRAYGEQVAISGGIIATSTTWGPDVTPQGDGFVDAIDLQCGSTCNGDLDGNQTIDLLDFAILQTRFAEPATGGPQYGDFNRDGIVDIADFVVFRANLGTQCP